MKDCFSYVRFSSKGQTGNSSVDRQAPIAQKVAIEKGWNYREDLNAEDLGVSAYKGDNIATIETIIESAKAGKIPQGSVMVVEAFDRFSRADLDTAEDLLKKYLKAGLEIFIYRGGHHLTRDSINRPIERIVALLELAQANEYSAKLSNRVKTAFDLKKAAVENGTAKGFSRKHVPGWITPEGTTDSRNRFTITGYHLNEKAQSCVKFCNLYLQDVGVCEITRQLNKSGAETLNSGLHKGEKREWAQSVIYRQLSNHQLIGNQSVDGTGKAGFYPAVITEETFLKIQAKLNDNRGKYTYQSANNRINNIFSEIAFCEHCGKPLKVSRGGGRPGHNYSYVSCHGYFKGSCAVKNPFRYNLLEDSFVTLLKGNAERLIQDEQGNQAAHNIAVFQGKVVGLEKEIETLQKDADELAKLGMSTVRIQIQINERDEQIAATKKQIALESANGVSAKGGLETVTKIIAKLDSLATETEFRAQVMGWIRQHISRVTVNRATLQAVFLFKNGYEIHIDLRTGTVQVAGEKVIYAGVAGIMANSRAVKKALSA